MAERVATVPIRRMPKTAKMMVVVRLTREFRARTWVASRLFALAACVMGGTVELRYEGVRFDNEKAE